MSQGLNRRSRSVLFAVVTEFIAHGDPVGSRTLARRYGLDLSPATIRNVLADLEDLGLLAQPHTSAGRVPTDRALRLFIDSLIDLQDVSPETMEQMSRRFREIYSQADDPLRETGEFLSELAGSAAVITLAPTPASRLSQLRFIRTQPTQLLAVLVFADGSVENRFIREEQPTPEPELQRIHNLLNDVIEGRTLGEVRDLFARRLADEQTALDELRHRAFSLAAEAVDRGPTEAQVRIEGHARLLDLPEYGDIDRVKRLVRALAERKSLVDLLDKTMTANAVTVFVGNETGELGDGELSLVVAPYRKDGEPVGTLGVLGPTRMNYARVMPLVEATASALSDTLDKRNS